MARIDVANVKRPTGVRCVFSGPDGYEFDATNEHFATVKTVEEVSLVDEGLAESAERVTTAEVPIVSVGRNRKTGQVYYATDDRFIRHPGIDLLWPVIAGHPVSLAIERNPDNGRWAGRVIAAGAALYASGGHVNAAACEEALRAYCDREGLKVAGDPKGGA